MAGGIPYTAREDHAIRLLYQTHRANWERHVNDYPVLAGRTISSIKFRIYKSLGLGAVVRDEMARRVEPEAWPEFGVHLFHDDPRAIDDHGSLGRVTPAVTRSMSGCSAAWAVG